MQKPEEFSYKLLQKLLEVFLEVIIEQESCLDESCESSGRTPMRASEASTRETSGGSPRKASDGIPAEGFQVFFSGRILTVTSSGPF